MSLQIFRTKIAHLNEKTSRKLISLRCIFFVVFQKLFKKVKGGPLCTFGELFGEYFFLENGQKCKS